MIFLFTDFGLHGPYVGEMHAVIRRQFPSLAVIDLMHDAPATNPKAAGILLSALSRRFESGDGCVAVIDPGVGSRTRRALMIEADGVTYTGPDNGLFVPLVHRSHSSTCYEIFWQPATLSDSFHGRDLFAPALVRKLSGKAIELREIEPATLAEFDSIPACNEIIYVDKFGNAISGISAGTVPKTNKFVVGGMHVSYARVFSEVKKGHGFWYENSMGLIELAVNQGSFAETYNVTAGTTLEFES